MPVYTHNLTIAFADGSDTLGTALPITGDTEVKETYSVPINADTAKEIAINMTGLKSIYLLSTHALVLTFKDSVPASQGAITLVANIAYRWTHLDDPTLNPNPIGADTVTMHINSSAVATLEVRILQNA